MLNIKAALVALVLGSSSAAMASPSVTFTATAQAGWSTGPDVRDHRAYSMPTRTSWVQLSAPATLRSGSSIIRPQLSTISQLRLQANRGMTYVQRVDLRFRDGTYQSLTVNRWLSVASSIDLSVRNNRKLVDTVTVIGSSNRNASYQLFGQGSNLEAPVYQPPTQPVSYPPVYQPPVYQPPYYGMSLGSDMSFLNTDGRRFLDVGADKGSFNTLRLQGASGSTYVQMVQIDFTDGTQQFLGAVNKTLLPGQSFDIDLDGYNARSILRVTVWTDSSGHAIQNSTGTFNASLL